MKNNRILVVDNGTSYLPQLKKLLAGNTVTVAGYKRLKNINGADFDVLVLSGGHTFPVSGNEKKLSKEIELILNFRGPVFGICYGFELLAAAFGAKLKKMAGREKGVLEIIPVKTDKIFDGIQNFMVFENHRYVVTSLPADLIPLARSRDGIEAFRHRFLPIYAVQFHPEMFTDVSGGDEIFKNFLASSIEPENEKRDPVMNLYFKIAGSDLMSFYRRQLVQSLHLWPLSSVVFVLSFLLIYYLRISEFMLSPGTILTIKALIIVMLSGYLIYGTFLDSKIFVDVFSKNKHFKIYRAIYLILNLLVFIYFVRLAILIFE